ncbi:MAG: DNA-binding protein [Pseudomonadota bacterium]
MGRVAIVEFYDVAISANKMLAAGKKPTARLVLDDLGSGSMSTIQTHFKQWQADHALHLPNANFEILSPDITRAINLTIATLVSEATDALSETLAEENATCKQIQKEYAKLLEEYETQAAILAEMESQYANLTGRAELLESENKRAATEISSERKSVESARTELAIVKYKIEHLSQLEAEVEMLRSELKLANDQAAEFSKAAAVAEAKLGVAMQHGGKA